MILQGIIDLFGTILGAVFGLLPDIAPPNLDAIMPATAKVYEFFAWANYWLPVDQASIMLGTIAAAFTAVLLFRITVWVLTKLHILGGQDS